MPQLYDEREASYRGPAHPKTRPVYRNEEQGTWEVLGEPPQGSSFEPVLAFMSGAYGEVRSAAIRRGVWGSGNFGRLRKLNILSVRP